MKDWYRRPVGDGLDELMRDAFQLRDRGNPQKKRPREDRIGPSPLRDGTGGPRRIPERRFVPPGHKFVTPWTQHFASKRPTGPRNRPKRGKPRECAASRGRERQDAVRRGRDGSIMLAIQIYSCTPSGTNALLMAMTGDDCTKSMSGDSSGTKDIADERASTHTVKRRHGHEQADIGYNLHNTSPEYAPLHHHRTFHAEVLVRPIEVFEAGKTSMAPTATAEEKCPSKTRRTRVGHPGREVW